MSAGPRSPSDFAADDRAARWRPAVAVGGGACLAVAVALLATQPLGTPGRWFAIGQSLTPWMPVATIFVATVAWLVGSDVTGGVAGIATLGYLAVLSPLAFADALPDAAPDATPLIVASANVLYTNTDHDGLARWLAEVDADVVAIIEADPDQLGELAERPVAAEYPHRSERPGGAAGLAIWSRYPIEAVSAMGGMSATAMEVIVDHPDGAVRIIGAHPPPPVLDHDVWLAEIERLPDVIDGRPTVVLGDFNASWFHPPFRRAVDEAGLVNVAAATGNGLSMTWPTDSVLPPFVAIDHVLVSDRLTALGTEIVTIPGSDHRGVVAELAFAATG